MTEDTKLIANLITQTTFEKDTISTVEFAVWFNVKQWERIRDLVIKGKMSEGNVQS